MAAWPPVNDENWQSPLGPGQRATFGFRKGPAPPYINQRGRPHSTAKNKECGVPQAGDVSLCDTGEGEI
jgi:hypothetical protein